MSPLVWIGLGGVFGLFWLYVAARVVTRAVLRSTREWRHERGEEDEEQPQAGQSR